MAQDKNDFLAGYVEEVQTYVPIMRAAIRELREDPRKRTAQEELHRLAHIIHGASAMIGIGTLSKIAGFMEETLEQILEGRQVNEESLVAMETTVAHIESYCQSLQQGVPVDEEQAANLAEADSTTLDSDVDAMFMLNSLQEPAIDEMGSFVALSDIDPGKEPAAISGETEARVSPTLPRHIETPPSALEKTGGDASGKGVMSGSLFSEEEKQILYEGFLEEAEEHFQQLNDSIQILSAEIDGRIVPDVQQKEEIRKIRRAVHTIKGASAVIGLSNIAAYAHGVEDFLDWLYEDAPHLDSEMVTALTGALDHLSLLVDSPDSAAADREADLTQRLLTISRKGKSEVPAVVDPAPPVALDPAPSEDEAGGPDEGVQEALGQMDLIPTKDAAAPEAETLAPPSGGQRYGRRWDDPEPEAEAPESRRAPTSETTRTLRINQGQMDTLINLANELLVGISGFDQNMNLFKKTLEEMELASQRLKGIASELEAKFEVKALEQLSQHFFHLNQTITDIQTSQSFSEFDALELDRYTQLNLIIRSLNESAIDISAIHTNLDGVYSGIGGDIGRQRRAIREMQVQMLRTRMSPLSILFPRLNRTLRDVASRLGKQVHLVIEGEQVDLDRMVLEKLADPFMHLMRNAIHHGVESPSERQARKKPAMATLTLSTRREGNHLVIRFSDDGRGLDFGAIREKARQTGLRDTVDRMSTEQLTELIFYSGFSTKSVSEISGRGVGMDVVRENIRELQGSIAVETQTGEGTAFVIRIPITLGVVRALLVKIGDVTYGIPLDDIKDIHRLEQGSISFAEGTCKIADETIPWYSLNALLDAAGYEPEEDHSLALNMFAGGKTIALSIPHITGQKELVIKGLGTHLRAVAGVSGAAVMGDGSIVPVLDIPDLTQAASRAEHRAAFSFKLETPSVFTVMIVDDSISIRRVMNRLVSHNGWAPIEAKDGLDAAEQLENEEVRPDVIVLDIEMPRMNGFEFLAKLPNIPGGKDIPVIMLTSRTSEKHQEKAMQLGARAFLNKPVKDEEFVDTVLRLTGQDSDSVLAPVSGDKVLA